MTLRSLLPRLAAAGVAVLALVAVAVISGGTTDGPAPAVESPHGTSFRENCAMCHRPESWTPARISDKFDHSKYGFALTGAHKGAPCLQCHQNLEFTSAKGSKCADCHQDVHLGEMGPDCARCHSTRDFVDRSESTKMHRSTRFPLTGAHLTTDCAGCHIPNGTASMSFLNTPTTCDGCHLPQYRATTSPNHEGAGFPTDCATCHSTNLWSAGAFDHATTGFPLTGAHRPLACQQCHADNKFTPISPECVSCHRADYDATASPSHATVGFPTQCATCHGTTSWGGASFDHAATGFALTGQHQTQSCQACHGNGPFTPLDPACVSCHRANYDATTDPNHASVGFPTDCVTCHGTGGWDGASFNHAVTGFALTGAHTTQSCQACHGAGPFTPLDPACVSCHRAQYDATTDPPHASVGFPTDCVSCHSTTTWNSATFNHATTGFPLTGAHIAQACQACHVPGNPPPSPLCVSCHQSDYDGTTDPPHAAAGFSTDCASCHGTTTWQGATFDHDGQFFPIYSGRHRGQWSACIDCHVSPPSYATFECITCHEHSNRTEVDNKHNGVSGYEYLSTRCYACHPQGRA